MLQKSGLILEKINISSNWFSFDWIQGIKICLRNSCSSARKVLEGNTTEVTDCGQPPRSDSNPKCSRTQNFTPGIFQPTWSPLFSIYPENIYCSICPFITTYARCYYVLKMWQVTKENNVPEPDKWGQQRQRTNNKNCRWRQYRKIVLLKLSW